MIRAIIAAILFFVSFCAYADGDHPSSGGRAAGMADAALINQDEWSVFNNQAGMAGIDSYQAALYYENRFLLKQTGYGALAFTMPALSGNLGMSMSHFGYSLYNENHFGLAYAKELFNHVSMGIQVDYLFVHQPGEYGNRNAVTFEFGVLAEPTEELRIAAHVYNPVQVSYIGYSDEYLPVSIAAGAGYTFSKKFTISAEAEKILHLEPVIFRLGLEYKALNGLALRTGISSYPVKAAFGLGFVSKKFKADIAYSWHQVLGSTPHISVAYAF